MADRAAGSGYAPSPMPFEIDVVVTAYGRYDLTASCLAHLKQQTVEHKLTVVVNGSVNGEAASIRRDFPAASVIELESNRGFAEATNIGVAAGDGDVVVLLNNDVDCDPTFLEELVRPLEEDRSAGSTAALLLQPGRMRVDSIGLAADPTLACFPRHQGLARSSALNCALVLAGPAGAGAAYRRSAWEEVGGLEENLVAYMEDFELALRLRGAGWSAAVAPDAMAVHLGSATFLHRSEFQIRSGGFGRGYLLRRYGVLQSRSAPRAALTEALVVVTDAVISRDTAALAGRLAGWHAARGLPRRKRPPAAAIDEQIGFLESLRLRRAAYRRS